MRSATVFGIFTNLVPTVCVTFRQRRRRRLRKRLLKSEFALLQT